VVKAHQDLFVQGKWMPIITGRHQGGASESRFGTAGGHQSAAVTADDRREPDISSGHNRERPMSRVLRTTARHAVFGSALAGLTLFSIGAARAGDLGPPVYGPAPYGGPVYGGPHGGPCRILLERRVDPYGRESVHRIRMCDDGPVYPGPAETAAPDYYPPPPHYYGPSPSGYDPYPRPPAPIPGYYY
jgi:hypothetical protein